MLNTINGRRLNIEGNWYDFQKNTWGRIAEEGGIDLEGTWRIESDERGYYISTKPTISENRLYFSLALIPEKCINDVIILQ